MPASGYRTESTRPELRVTSRLVIRVADVIGAEDHGYSRAMRRYRYRILNVFGFDGDPFSGNPLCVFEDARALTDDQMQGLARQFNLSETTFLLPSDQADARVRIFTPSFEMPFAGHPTLGSAYVVHKLRETQESSVRLELAVGIVPITEAQNRWTFEAPSALTRPCKSKAAQLAAMLGIEEADLGAPALWVNAGNEQLLIPLLSEAALTRCQPSLAALQQHARVDDERCLVYVFTATHPQAVSARLFFNHGNSVVEDPATGSACANLGGYLHAIGATLPRTLEVEQGRQVQRPSRLGLRVDTRGVSFVSGAVRELGEGYVSLP